ncbi:MAG: hypothetical protein FJ405_19835, partial [Verrucomicrobia bacterium]|nr:hypothetical protein [Verrucomicrobiota bacterium]
MTRHSTDSSAAFPSVWSRWVQLLRSPVDAASLALFRIGLGIVMALEALDLCLPYPQAISMGGSPLETYFTGGDIRFHFPYEGFEWLPLLPKTWIHVVTGLLGVSSLLMAAGWKHRWTSGTACLCWIYLWTVESTRSYWQSHYYMEALALFLIVWTPASAVMSVDAWRARRNSKPSSNLVPFWPVLLLRGQLVIAYFYAGVAKINLDWLLGAVPVRWFLTEPHVTAPYAKWMPQSAFTMFESFVHSVPFAYFLSYTGLVFDLLIGFLFLFRRSRYLAMALMALFHLTNHFLIFENIGRFPLAGLATATIFLNTDWPRRFWRWVCHPRFSRPDWGWFWSGFIALPVVGGLLVWKAERTSLGTQGPPGSSLLTIARWTPMVVVGWLAWQAIIPLRHYFIAGDARFTYEGLSFSWRLKTDTGRGKVIEMQIKDEQIIPASGPNAGRVQWEQWKEAPVIYRKVKPEELAWDSLPELIIVAEPLVGDRIFYNQAARGAATTELEARRRVQRWWN